MLLLLRSSWLYSGKYLRLNRFSTPMTTLFFSSILKRLTRSTVVYPLTSRRPKLFTPSSR
ncbi:hypothetical protein D3C86_2071370 [compost metagenome]